MPKNIQKTKKRKGKSYKNILKEILKPKDKSTFKDKKKIENNTGGGSFKQITKI